MSTDPPNPIIPNISNNTGNIAVGNNISQTIIQQAAPAAKPRAVQHPMPDISGAVGRATELAALAVQLQQADTAAVVPLIGVAGVGKSTFAAMYCRDYGAQHQFVCWRDVLIDGTVGGLLLAVAEKLGIDFDLRQLPPNEPTYAAQLVDWLQQCGGLLVVDNCETLLDEDGNATGGWEVLFAARQLGHSRLLLTSSRQIHAALVLIKPYSIVGLTEADGVALLREQGLSDDEALLKQACERVDGHPLALIFLAQLVTIKKSKLSTLLADSDRWGKDVAEYLRNQVYKLLPALQQRTLQYISVYDRPGLFRYPVRVAEVAGMLAALPDELRPDAAAWTADLLDDYASELAERSLLEGDDESGYTLHPIIRDYTYPLLLNPTAHHRAAATYFQQQYAATHPDAHTNPAKDLADVQPLLAAYDQLCAAEDYQAAAKVLDHTYFEYLSGGNGVNLYGLLDRWSEFSRGTRLLERLVTAPADALDDSTRAAALGNLGLAYQSLGEYDKAIDYNSRALKIDQQIGNKKGQAQDFGNLGNAYGSLGDYVKAVENLTSALVIMAQIGDLQGQAATVGNLGNVYQSLGEYSKAIDYHSDSLTIKEQLGDFAGQARSLGNLGNAYQSLGEYGKAIDYHKSALKLDVQTGNVLGQAQTFGNLGTAYYALGQYSQALDYYQQAKAIFERIGANQMVAQVDNYITDTQQKVAEGVITTEGAKGAEGADLASGL